MSNATEIGFDSEFAKCLRAYFYTHNPEAIIETGTYHGNGSTAIIASLIRDIPIGDAAFYSIECNREFIDIALDNLEANKLDQYVSIIHGLSIPRSLLPTVEIINFKIGAAKYFPGIIIDHRQDPDNAANYYFKETSFGTKDDCLGKLLEFWNNCADFVFLDSGGHIGDIEFRYLISKLKCPCGIALDDTNHLKHYNSLNIIKSDSRFEIINEGSEKFGFCIAKFTP